MSNILFTFLPEDKPESWTKTGMKNIVNAAKRMRGYKDTEEIYLSANFQHGTGILK